MISERCWDAYLEQYGLGSCTCTAPAGPFEVRINGKVYIEPEEEEPEEVFMDRLKRSKEQGENLFAKEWPELEPIDWSSPERKDIVV